MLPTHTITCGNTGEPTRLTFAEIPRKPYAVRVTCPACGETWTHTESEQAIKALLARAARAA